MKILTIIIPCYNAENYLPATFNSLYCFWNRKDIDFIFVNDGSTDMTKSLLSDIVDVSNVTVIEKENGGVSSARNAGISVANGSWLYFMDADDTINPQMLHEALLILQKSKFELIQVTCNIIKNSISQRFQVKPNRGLEVKDYCVQNFINNPFCFFYKRNLIIENKLLYNTDFKYAEDMDFTLRYMQVIKNGFEVFNLPLYNYYIHMSSAMGKRMTPDIIIQNWLVIDKLMTDGITHKVARYACKNLICFTLQRAAKSGYTNDGFRILTEELHALYRKHPSIALYSFTRLPVMLSFFSVKVCSQIMNLLHK